MSFIERIVPVLFALIIGIGVAAIYLFPLVAYNRFFDVSVISAHHPEGEFGRYFLMASVSDISHNRIFIPGVVGAICLTFLVARYVWRADVGLACRLVMLLTLGLGILMVIPDFGPKLVAISGFRTSGFATISAYSMWMLFTSLFTIALGLLAYCRIARADTDNRARLLLLLSCSVFIFMLPWTAAIWKAIPELAIFQFPWRLCGILTFTVAGLLALAVDDCLRHRVGTTRWPSPTLLSAVVLAISAGGGLIWRADTRLLTFDTPRVDVTRNVDPMYPAYVPAPHLAAFANLIGTSPDSFAVAPTPVEDGVHAAVTSGQCAASTTRLGPRKLHVSAECRGDARLRIGQLYFPLWRIVPMTRRAGGQALGSSAEGLIELSLASGRHSFELVFDGGLPEKCGAIVTVASILVVAGGFAFARVQGRRSKLLQP